MKTRRARLALEALEDRLLLSADLRGTLYDDRDGDGYRDAGEPALAGRVVFLDADRDGVLDSGERQTTTASDGSYRFAALAPGRYLVTQLPPSGWRATAPLVAAAIATVPDGGALIGMDRFRADARFAGIDGRGLSVAVIDSGIAPHPFFPYGTVAAQYDFLANDAVADDTEGHGTAMTSLIASRDRTWPGFAPGVRVIVLKALGGPGEGDFSMIERAARWVIDHGAQYNVVAVNLSFGDGSTYTTQQSRDGLGDELAALVARGVTVVAAAGNEHDPGVGAGLTYPAIDPSSLPVGAVWDANHGGPWSWSGGARDDTTAPDRIVSFSQRLAGVGQVFAPGTLLTGAARGGGTKEQSGTSVATAVVSGVVALAQQIARDRLGRLLSVSELRGLIEQTGVVIRDGDDEDDNVQHTNATFRRINVMALAEAILAKGSVSPGRSAASRDVSLSNTAVTADLGARHFNSAPSLSGDGQTTTLPEDSTSPPGVSIDKVIATTFHDPDAGAKRGVAVIETTGTTWGHWQYSLDGGSTWREMGTVSKSQALLLRAEDLVRFIPNANANGTATIGYHAWDRTTGTVAARVNLTTTGATGGSTAFGTTKAIARFVVRPINDAPVVSGPGRLTSSSTGDSVASILAGTASDVDLGTVLGLAIIGSSGNGRWQFSRDGGSTWSDLGAVSPGRARLLGPTDRLRFIPAAGWTGSATLTYRAWDRTTGSAGAIVDLSDWADIGGTTAFSKQSTTATRTVA